MRWRHFAFEMQYTLSLVGSFRYFDGSLILWSCCVRLIQSLLCKYFAI